MADKKLEKQGLLIGGPGLVLQLIGGAMVSNTEEPSGIAIALCGIGVIMLFVGLGLTAKSKGYPAYYGILGFFSLIGVIILGVLPDKLAEQAKNEEIARLQRELAEKNEDAEIGS